MRCLAKQNAADLHPLIYGRTFVRWLTGGNEEIREFPMAKQDVPGPAGVGTD